MPYDRGTQRSRPSGQARRPRLTVARLTDRPAARLPSVLAAAMFFVGEGRRRRVGHETACVAAVSAANLLCNERDQTLHWWPVQCVRHAVALHSALLPSTTVQSAATAAGRPSLALEYMTR